MPKLLEKKADETIALPMEGYLFIKNRTDKYKSDVYETTLLGQEVICITGREAAQLFYDGERFARAGAAPLRVQRTLTGENTVQGLDGAAHAHRKALFMSLATAQHPKILAGLATLEWEAALPRWEAAERVVLLDEAKRLLFKIACVWAGVPLPETEVTEYANDFAAMVDGFGGVGPRYLRGKSARTKAEAWMTNVIENVRAGRVKAPEGSALEAMARHLDHESNPLDPLTAARELMNLLRPITAISTYIAFMALALHEHPAHKESLVDADARHCFVQEVRRFYPFTPFVGARVTEEFNWQGCDFRPGTLVLLDVHGINHDSRIWEGPFEFRPERFRGWHYDPFAFIPHGGGDPAEGHRCPGEAITVEIMKASLDFLVNKIDYRVPAQNLSYNMARIPTFPESGVAIEGVRAK